MSGSYTPPPVSGGSGAEVRTFLPGGAGLSPPLPDFTDLGLPAGITGNVSFYLAGREVRLFAVICKPSGVSWDGGIALPTDLAPSGGVVNPDLLFYARKNGTPNLLLAAYTTRNPNYVFLDDNDFWVDSDVVQVDISGFCYVRDEPVG